MILKLQRRTSRDIQQYQSMVILKDKLQRSAHEFNELKRNHHQQISKVKQEYQKKISFLLKKVIFYQQKAQVLQANLMSQSFITMQLNQSLIQNKNKNIINDSFALEELNQFTNKPNNGDCGTPIIDNKKDYRIIEIENQFLKNALHEADKPIFKQPNTIMEEEISKLKAELVILKIQNQKIRKQNCQMKQDNTRLAELYRQQIEKSQVSLTRNQSSVSTNLSKKWSNATQKVLSSITQNNKITPQKNKFSPQKLFIPSIRSNSKNIKVI